MAAAGLLLAVAVFLNIELPFIADTEQALILIAALMWAGVLVSVAHYLLVRL